MVDCRSIFVERLDVSEDILGRYVGGSCWVSSYLNQGRRRKLHVRITLIPPLIRLPESLVEKLSGVLQSIAM